jgi:gamma-glutamyltranspeptidase/glutathione hydrolase
LANDRHRKGPLSVGVPGVLGGLCLLAEKYGRLGLKAVMEPAIERAGSGVSLTPGQMMTWLTMKAAAEGQPPPERAGLPKQLVMEDLAATLRSIADQGPAVFYEGRIGRAIAEHVQRLGGILTSADMAAYRAEVVPAVSVQVGEHRLMGPPPAAGSLTSMQMVALFAQLAERPVDDPALYHHWLTEVAKVCWEHRLTTLCDHRFMNPGPQTCLAAEELASLLARVRVGVKKPERGRVVAPDPLRGTVHLAAADGDGNVISWTQTHGGGFGSGVMVKGTGVVLGHGMCRFEPRPGWANSIAPGKRPLHNMCPVLVLREGKPVGAAGAAGGRTIVNNVAALLIHRFVLGRDTAASVSLGRSQVETIEPVTIERAAGPELLARLKTLGHELKEVSRDAGSAHFVTRQGETWQAAAESRSASAGVALA